MIPLCRLDYELEAPRKPMAGEHLVHMVGLSQSFSVMHLLKRFV